MEMSDIPIQSLTSVKQALAISSLRKTMNQDASSVVALLDSMQKANSKIMEQSVSPHLGGNIDIQV